MENSERSWKMSWKEKLLSADLDPDFLSKYSLFFVFFISGSRDFTQRLTSGGLTLIYSAEVCILVMACVDCARACSEKPFLIFTRIIEETHLLSMIFTFYGCFLNVSYGCFTFWSYSEYTNYW